MDYLEKNLKHYNLYMTKLIAFANCLGLKVIIRATEEDGFFSAKRNCIVVDEELSQANKVAVILHELGHAVQHYFGSELSWTKVSTAYSKTNTNITHKQVKTLVQYETEAWNIGFIIADILRIPKGKWLHSTKKYYVDHYRNYKK